MLNWIQVLLTQGIQSEAVGQMASLFKKEKRLFKINVKNLNRMYRAYLFFFPLSGTVCVKDLKCSTVNIFRMFLAVRLFVGNTK